MVTRKDLPVGDQACQLAHAMREFVAEYPEMEKQWYLESNHICFLAVKNRSELESFIKEADKREICYSCFYEDDLDKDLTAVAFEPSIKSRKLLSQIPLAFK